MYIYVFNSLVGCQIFTNRILPKHLECFGKFPRHTRLENRLNMSFKPHTHLFIPTNQSLPLKHGSRS